MPQEFTCGLRCGMLLYLRESMVAAVARGESRSLSRWGREADVARRVRGTSFMRRRKRIEPTGDWDQLVPLFEWPEQKEYEEIRPLVLFGSSVAERARVTGTPERTM